MYGLMTVVLQAGEDPRRIPAGMVTDLIHRIRGETGLTITLSLGERRPEELAEWREAGAERYLLKIETANRELYESTQPGRRDAWARRMEVLEILRELEYEVGSGLLVGLPGQTFEVLADDLVHLREFSPDMIGSGPWLPHPATPPTSMPRTGTDQVPNDAPTTLKVLALTRLLCPDTNLPATTALTTVGGAQARESGLEGGANVIMPDLTPARYGRHYDIYPERQTGTPADLPALKDTFGRLGRTVSSDPGRSVAWLKRPRRGTGVPAGEEVGR
jgi:biotin synthase